ncbi:MAG: hypothetical protein WDM92_04925 [Caulobacteraceae bacterium]
MAVYLTKTWGFSSPSGPLQFSQQGWRERARSKLRDGDLVVIVGTLGENTDEVERGRVLGLMEPTCEVVSSLDYDLVRGPQDYDEAGDYRWPFGLELRRAWRFLEPRPLLSELTDRRFHMDSAQGIVELTPQEAAAILSLPREEVGLLRPIAAAARIEGAEAARRKAAPPPTTTRRGVMHMRRAPAYTYALGVVGVAQGAFKIGWAFDWKQRMRQFNQASLPRLGGLTYTGSHYHLWTTATEAYRMEQSLLRYFDARRHRQNTEVVVGVGEAELASIWNDYLVEHRRRRVVG